MSFMGSGGLWKLARYKKRCRLSLNAGIRFHGYSKEMSVNNEAVKNTPVLVDFEWTLEPVQRPGGIPRQWKYWMPSSSMRTDM